jgi:hypothetical protein
MHEDTFNSFLQDTQLTKLMQAVASHDGSFDDFIDQSSCFSIKFPYEIQFNGETYTVKSENDIFTIDAYDMVKPVFPLTIVFADYIELEVTTPKDFETYKSQCLKGLFYDDGIYCVDLTYPVRISIYNTDNSDYQTVVFNHDKEVFLGIGLFDSGTLASINYPIRVQMIDGTQWVIESDEELKSRILQMIPLCQ